LKLTSFNSPRKQPVLLSGLSFYLELTVKINNETAATKIAEYDESKMFSVKFIKRTDGTIRDMLCRKGVSLGVSGEGQKYDPAEKNLCVVLDVLQYNQKLQELNDKDEAAKQSFRQINLETIISLKMDGNEYFVNDFPIIAWTVKWKEGKREVLARTDGEAQIAFKRLMNMTRMPRNAEVYPTK